MSPPPLVTRHPKRPPRPIRYTPYATGQNLQPHTLRTFVDIVAHGPHASSCESISMLVFPTNLFTHSFSPPHLAMKKPPTSPSDKSDHLARPAHAHSSTLGVVTAATVCTVFIFCFATPPRFLRRTKFISSTSSLFQRSKIHVPPAQRVASNLVYWKPHKTASTSVRSWLIKVSKQIQVPLHTTEYYPNSRVVDHLDRLTYLNTHNDSLCSIFAGHIRVSEVTNRVNERDERTLGAVITSTRNSFNTLASKYFHRTGRTLNYSQLSEYNDKFSKTARFWFFYWNDNDPCEPLRYYDGVYGCDMSDQAIDQRARDIAQRMDCVVDTDDPNDDLWALCQVIGIRNRKQCPDFPSRRVRAYNHFYSKLYEIRHIRRIIRPSLKVTDALRNRLLERRCRFLQIADGIGNGILKADQGKGAAPRWPALGCKSFNSTIQFGKVWKTPKR